MSRLLEFVYSAEKSRLLREHRGLGFEEVIEYIENGWVIGVRHTPDQKKHPNQLLMDIEIEGHIYTIPFYLRSEVCELKTLYRSRKARKHYLGGTHEKEHKKEHKKEK